MMIGLLGYVAIWLPIDVCFGKQNASDTIKPGDVIDTIVDLLFTIDICLNFISAYDDPITGLPVISLTKIAKNYITGWFWIDLISVIPV